MSNDQITMNECRAAAAFQTAEHFADLTGLSVENDGLLTVIKDLVVNLLHLADAASIDRDDLMATVQQYHAAEVTEERDLLPPEFIVAETEMIVARLRAGEVEL